LFVFETGTSASWDQSSAARHGVLSIEQIEGEPPWDFARRVLERVAASESFGERLQSAVVFVGYRGDVAAVRARRALALGLAIQSTATSAPELSFCANAGATGHAREELLELAEEIESTWAAHAAPIRLQVGTTTVLRPDRRRAEWMAPLSDSYG